MWVTSQLEKKYMVCCVYVCVFIYIIIYIIICIYIYMYIYVYHIHREREGERFPKSWANIIRKMNRNSI
jgi:hypothetical protein